MAKKLFLDLEASSLSWNSYPIEIAWGNSLDNIENYLISPKNIKEWTDWSGDSEGLHGISRAMLMEKGVEPSVICSKFQQASQGCEVYTNNPCWDAMWLHKLFYFAGQDIPSVDIKHSDELFSKTLCTSTEKRLEGLYFCLKLKRRVSDEMRNRHRASVDVEYLIRTYNLAKNAAITGA